MTLRRLGLTARLLWLGLLPGLLVMLALGWLLDGAIRDSLYGGLAQRLDEHADRIEANLIVTPTGQWQHTPGRGNDAFSQIFSGWYWVLETNDKPLVSRSLWDGSLAPTRAPGAGGLVASADPRGRPLLGLLREITLNGQQAQLGVYVLADEVTSDLRRIRRVLWLVLAVLLVAAAVTTVIQVRVGLQPLAVLRERLGHLHGAAPTAVRTGEAPPHTLGQGYGPDLDPLAHEIDALLERNARMLARGRAHAADLSHALKTPLARLAAEASRNPQVPARLVLAQVESIHGLIERHLSRTRSAEDAAASLQQAVPVHEVITQLVQVMQQIHPAKALAWQVEVPPTLHWRGDRSDLEEMLGNLLDNASKWARHQVQVTVAMEAPADVSPAPVGAPAAGGQNMLRIEVADDGPGIADAHLQTAGQRGQRFDQTTPGTGLGLSIVAEIAHAWGGQLALSRSDALHGLQAVLRLPAR